MKRLYFVLVVGTTLIVLLFFTVRFNSMRNATDGLAESLSPINTILTNHSRLSLVADEEGYTELYYKVQFVLVPNIVEKSKVDNDTILIIHRREGSNRKFDFESFNVIYHQTDSLFDIALLSKKQ